jgi:hypothetical protein
MEPLGGKWRPLVEKVGEWYVESRYLKGCSPHLCRLRTDRLAPVSKFWTYQSHAGIWPSKPSSRLSTEAWLFSTASLTVVGEKLGTDPWIGQPSCCGLCQEPFFLGAVDLFKSVDGYAKGYYTWTMSDTYGRWSYVNWGWIACGMLVEFFLTGCISIRIAVTLGYEYRLFVTVIT